MTEDPLISIVINADTRKGYLNDSSTVGDFGQGSLQGVRSVDFLIEGVKNKMDFFRGYGRQCILYVDKHEDIPVSIIYELQALVDSYRNNSKLVIKEHDRKKKRWYDYITLEALKLADGDYVVHFDNDANAFRSDNSTILEQYFEFLDTNIKYVCQPSDLSYAQHQMWWASTRFFICKKETLNLSEIEKCLDHNYLLSHYGKRNYKQPVCCLEHTLGYMAGEGNVLYPRRDDENYIVFSWARYNKGALGKLNQMPYSEVQGYIFNKCSFSGANDVLDI